MMENKWEDCLQKHSENMVIKQLIPLVGIVDQLFGREKVVVF